MLIILWCIYVIINTNKENITAHITMESAHNIVEAQSLYQKTKEIYYEEDISSRRKGSYE